MLLFYSSLEPMYTAEMGNIVSLLRAAVETLLLSPSLSYRRTSRYTRSRLDTHPFPTASDR